MTCNVLILGANADELVDEYRLEKYYTFSAIDGRQSFKKKKEVGFYTPLPLILSNKAGPVTFYERKFADCSSVLEPNWIKVNRFGLQPHFELSRCVEVDAYGPSELVKHLANIDISVNCIKSDLEGLDFLFCHHFVRLCASVDIIQMELRADPFYQGEVGLSSAINEMMNEGFVVISMKTEHWLPLCDRNISNQGGLVAHSDVIFARQEFFNDYPVTAARLKNFILSLYYLNLLNVAEYFMSIHMDKLEAEFIDDIQFAIRRKRRRNRVGVLTRPFRYLKRFLLPGNMNHVAKN